MIATETIVPSMKLKIKLSSKRVEVDSKTKCQLQQRVSHVDDNGSFRSKEKSYGPVSIKRGPQSSIEGQKEKRQKIDRKACMHCAAILKSLKSHKYSWVFNKPVDPVELNIPDYFTVISQPMDLGTIQSKLEKNIYFGMEEFAADVRLTFSNAMAYNPPSNGVHLMAKELKKIFERKWKDLVKKWKCETAHEKVMTEKFGVSVRKGNGIHTSQKDSLSQKSQIAEAKGIQKISSLAEKDAKVKVPTSSQTLSKSIVEDMQNGKDNCGGRHPSVSVKASASLGSITCKCSICGDIQCHCDVHSNPAHSSSDITYEESEGRDLHDFQAQCKSPLQKISDVDSDGAVSALDSKHIYSSSQLTKPATNASSVEVWSTPVFDVQLSPKKALRAAMLKSRFADTILKAQQQSLLDHCDKSDPLKLLLEKERLERLQREEKARIEAQVKAAEIAAKAKAMEEIKRQMEKERKAARIAIEKVSLTLEVENNMQSFKEIEKLSGCRLSYQPLSRKDGCPISTLDKFQAQNPLEHLGLFMKDEYKLFTEDEDMEEILNGWEEGEILN